MSIAVSSAPQQVLVMPVAGTWGMLCPLRVLWSTLNALAGVSGPVVLKACEQGWNIHGNITSLLGTLSGPWDAQLLTCCLHSSAADQTFITPPNGFPTCWAPQGQDWAPGRLACHAQGYIWLPFDGLGSLAKFDTHLHLSPCFQHPAEQWTRETDKKPK